MSSATVHNGVSGNGTTDGDMYVIVVDENGVCSLSQKYAAPSDGIAFNLFADLNGDGNQEILGFRGHDSSYNGQAMIFGFGQDGTTLSSFSGINNDCWVGTTWNGAYAVGDIDNDGQPEIVATGGPSQTTYVLDASLNKVCETNLAGEVKLIGDLNGDGFKEIVLFSETGLLTVLDRNLAVLSTLQVGSDGENYLLSARSASGSMDTANDLVFAPVGRLPDGLSCSSDGTISGMPTHPVTNIVTMIAHDSLGTTAEKSLEIEIVEVATANGIPVRWLQLHGLPTDGSADFDRRNGSTFMVWQEWLAGTNPNDPSDDLRITESPEKQVNGFRIRWRSVASRTYRVERGTNLLSTTPFTPLETGIQGVDGVSEYIDQTEDGSGSVFYRITVE